MATFSGFEGYGGATITREVDGAGAVWIGCCAEPSGGRFGFYVFKNGQNVPISPFCSGRGSISRSGTWIAWEGNTHHTGALPGWTPLSGADLPPTPPTAGMPVAIPPGGSLASLYTGVYVAQDFDTPQETAQRVQKLLDALQELTDLLTKAGALV